MTSTPEINKAFYFIFENHVLWAWKKPSCLPHDQNDIEAHTGATCPEYAYVTVLFRNCAKVAAGLRGQKG